jgi:hypothetical protein
MRAFIAGLFVVLIAGGAIAAPVEKLAPVTLDDINAGMGAAPNLVSQGGLDCQVSNARKIGVDDKTQSTFYELACKGAEGFVFGEPAKKSKYPMVIYSCLEAATSKSAIKFGATCRLPENADPKAGIAALIASGHPGCAMTDARGVGHTDASTVLEVACQGGAGYVVEASYPLSPAKPAKFTPCAGIRPDMHTQCALTDAAAATAWVTSLPARAGKSCTVTNHRYVGFGADGDDYYEVACTGGGGFMLDVDAAGDVYPTPCPQADYLGGGCKLTKAR